MLSIDHLITWKSIFEVLGRSPLSCDRTEYVEDRESVLIIFLAADNLFICIIAFQKTSTNMNINNYIRRSFGYCSANMAIGLLHMNCSHCNKTIISISNDYFVFYCSDKLRNFMRYTQVNLWHQPLLHLICRLLSWCFVIFVFVIGTFYVCFTQLITIGPSV